MRFKLGLFLLVLAFAPSLFAGTTGNIRGVIRDSQTNEPVPGVTVVATSPSLIGEMVSISDEAGLYIVTDLPPGTYTVSATFTGAVSERRNIEVAVDKTLAVDLTINMTMSGEVYTIEEKAPNVDVATSTIGVTLSKEFLEKVPMGQSRDFGSAARLAPTASQDAGGITLSGATSPENNFVIDGIGAGDVRGGLIGSRLVTDFIEQFEVKEGGYGPEFGRSTGGFINAVTKSGSNEFHGSAFAYYSPRFLSIDPKDIVRADSTMVINRVQDYSLRVGAEAGGPIVKDLLWFHLGYAPDLTSTYDYRKYYYLTADANNLPVTQNGIGVYANSGQFDRYNTFRHRHEYVAKLTHLINNNNRHSLGLHGAPYFEDGYLVSSVRNAPYKSTWAGHLGDAVYNYNGQFLEGKLKIDGTLGAHLQNINQKPIYDDNMLQVIGTTSLRDIMNNGRFLEADGAAKTAVPAFCNSTFAANAVATTPCFASNYNSGNGLGFVENGPLWRLAQNLKFTSLFDFAGLHQLRYGIDFEQIFSNVGRRYGGNFFVQERSNQYRQQFFGRFNPDGTVQGAEAPWDIITDPDGLRVLSLTTNWGSFIGDSWNPIPTLTINYGVRWEVQNFFGVKSRTELQTLDPSPKFSIWDNIAPRAGLVWDFTSKGRGALKFNYGRYYESIPLTINERAFGGEALVQNRYRRLAPNQCYSGGWNNGVSSGTALTPEETAKLTAAEIPQKCRFFQQVPFGSATDALVAPGTKGQYSDEFILSANYEPLDSWVFGVSAIYRNLGSVIEDMSTDGGDTYFFGNPGSFDINTINDLRRDLLAETDPEKRATLEQLINQLPAINTFPQPVRRMLQLQFQLDKKLSDHFALLGSYVLSWNFGNYPGLLTSNNGQLDPNLTSQFDLPALLINRSGYLQQDRRHLIKLSGYYTASLKDYNESLVPLIFTLGLTGNVSSGGPMEALGADQGYGRNEAFLIPRGSAGRTPWVWSLDANVGIGYDFGDKMSFEVFAAVYNFTNNQAPLTIDQEYTTSFAHPAPGADQSQLAYTTDLVTGGPVVVNPNYGNATSYQTPLNVQLGARFKF